MPATAINSKMKPRERTLPLSIPCLRGKEAAYLQECVETGWVSSVGPFVDRFERELAAYVGAAHAVAVVNGTAGLHLALRVLGVQADDEVLVPTLTFIAPVNAIRYCGAHPVFVDADRATWQMDVEQTQAFLERDCEIRETVPGDRSCWNTRTGRRIRAILPVHLLGLSCNMEAILELARRFHLRILEDAAEAIGVRHRHRHAGTWGHMGVFSFNGNKTITCGGGGMIVADNKALLEQARYLSTQAKDEPREYVHHDIGYNYRLTNLQAAVGVAQLEQLPEFLKIKHRIAQGYRKAFANAPGVTVMPQQAGAAYWLYTILVRDRRQRDVLLAHLADQRIEARPLWQPIHTQRPYRDCQNAGPIEVATALYERAVSLPSSVGMTDEDIKRCAGVVREFLGSTG